MKCAETRAGGKCMAVLPDKGLLPGKRMPRPRKEGMLESCANNTPSDEVTRKIFRKTYSVGSGVAGADSSKFRPDTTADAVTTASLPC